MQNKLFLQYFFVVELIKSFLRNVLSISILCFSSSVIASGDSYSIESASYEGRDNTLVNHNNYNREKSEGFIGERYRGWLWFEEKPSEKNFRNKEQNQNDAKDQITVEQARREIEELKKQMDESRDIMIARPSAETVIAYMKLEEKMWERALALDSASRQAKFMYPEYFDKLKNPENVHAVKFKRKKQQEEAGLKIKNFAENFDLVFFSKGGCGYCKEFAPVLKRFAEEFGFKVEEASIDGEMSGLFEGKKMTDLAVRLGIEATPTVVVVSKDGKTAFELIRGYASISELEEYTGLAIEYAKERRAKLLNTNGRMRRKYE